MMRGKKHQSGVSTVVVLMVISIIVVIVFAIGAQGVWNLCFINKDTQKKISFYAAEAGVNEALLRYKNKATDPNWAQGIGSRTSPYQLTNNAYYYVEVFEAGEQIPTGGTVPTGMIYFLGTGREGVFTGTSVNPTFERQVGVMVKEFDECKFQYAVAVAGDFTVKNTELYGSVKVDGDWIQSTNCKIYRERLKDASGSITGYAHGRVLCGGQIRNGTNWLEIGDKDNNTITKQDIRARSGITGPSKCKDYEAIAAFDTSNDTLPFINDGSTTPDLSPGQQGQKLPNPDMTQLMSQVTQAKTFRNAGKTVFNFSGTVTSDGVYYFPDGVNFTGTIGTGCTKVTILTGKTSGQVINYNGETTYPVPEPLCAPGSIIWNTNTSVIVNLLALDGGTGSNWTGNGTVGGANIAFPNNCTLKGLIYCHGGLSTQGSFNVSGSVISYNGNQSYTNAESDFTFDRGVCSQAPGFSSWFSEDSGTLEQNIVSWQKF